MNTTSIFISAIIMTTALVALASPGPARAQHPQSPDETWVGMAPDGEALIVRVVSNGCTKREHFEVRVDAESKLSVKRTVADRCRRRPRFVDYRFSFEELGVTQPVFVELGGVASD